MKKTAKKARSGDIGVVLEHIDSKMDIVVEGQAALQKQITSVDTKVDDLKKEMDYKFGVVVSELHDFRKEVDYKFEAVFDEFHLIHNELKAKVGRDEFEVLEKRVTHLEKQSARK